MLVRTWNLDGGNIVPPRPAASTCSEMVELITAGSPDVVCLQEIPVWALPRLGGWGGMQALTARARRPKLGPLPVPPILGRRLIAAEARPPGREPERQGQRDPDPDGGDGQEPQDDHPEHERVLRGARRPLRADAEGDGLRGSASGASATSSSTSCPRGSASSSRTSTRPTARATCVSPTPSCGGRSTSSSAPPSSRRR